MKRKSVSFDVMPRAEILRRCRYTKIIKEKIRIFYGRTIYDLNNLLAHKSVNVSIRLSCGIPLIILLLSLYQYNKITTHASNGEDRMELLAAKPY